MPRLPRGKVQLNVYIDEDLACRFKKYVKNKYKYMYGLSKEVEKAMRMYLEKQSAHTHKQNSIMQYTDGAYVGIVDKTSISPSDYLRLQYLVKMLRKHKKMHGDRISGGSIDKFIERRRWSIPKYRRLLLQYGYISVADEGYEINV